jgi:hypothetical protein
VATQLLDFRFRGDDTQVTFCFAYRKNHSQSPCGCCEGYLLEIVRGAKRPRANQYHKLHVSQSRMQSAAIPALSQQREIFRCSMMLEESRGNPRRASTKENPLKDKSTPSTQTDYFITQPERSGNRHAQGALAQSASVDCRDNGKNFPRRLSGA